MLKRPKSDGRCIHCREVLIKRTKDHVFPSSWYPDSTPPTVQRWTAPSCERCNGEFGEMEKELFVRLALCVDPRKPAAQGLSERAVRSFGVDVQGISEEERRHREALRDKIRGEMKPYTPDIEPHILPGLGPHPELPAGEQIRIDIPGDLVHAVAKKIVRGCEYWLANGRIIEPPCEIEVLVVHQEDVPDILAQALAESGSVPLGPGLRIQRFVPQDDPSVAVYKLVIWDSLTLHFSILPPESVSLSR
jgi:hypothetical protein